MTLRKSGEKPFYIYRFDDVVILAFLVDIVDGGRCILNIVRWEISDGTSSTYILLKNKHVWWASDSVRFTILAPVDDSKEEDDHATLSTFDAPLAQLANAAGGILFFLDDATCSDIALKWLRTTKGRRISLPDTPITPRLIKIFDVLQLIESDISGSKLGESAIDNITTSDTRTWPEINESYDCVEFDISLTAIDWQEATSSPTESLILPKSDSSLEYTPPLEYSFEEPLMPYSLDSPIHSLYLSAVDKQSIDPLDTFEWRARGFIEELKFLLRGQDHSEVCALLRDHMKSLKVDRTPRPKSEKKSKGGVTMRMQKLASKMGRKIRRVVES